MTRMKISTAAALLAMTMAGCNQTAETAAGTAIGVATRFDPTGLSGTAVSLARSVRPEASSSEGPDEIDLSRYVSRLRDVAAGRTARPKVDYSMDDQLKQMAINEIAGLASSIANAAISGALTGGIGLASAAEGIAMQAAGSGVMMAQMAAANQQMKTTLGNAEAQRAASRTVPDEDRPSEARAILSIVNGPDGRSASWRNPRTGASGTVTIRDVELEEPDGLRCRMVWQGWSRAGQGRSGAIAVCLYRGEWYDLS